MGIDVYLSWDGMNADDQEGQITGFSVTSGDKGYLREAYHGGPYATMLFIPEGWEEDAVDEDGNVTVPASVLRRRLPAVVICCTVRDALIYGGMNENAEAEQDRGCDIPEDLKEEVRVLVHADAFACLMEQMRSGGDNAEALKRAMDALKRGRMSVTSKAFIDFAALAAEKELATNQPCQIHVSY